MSVADYAAGDRVTSYDSGRHGAVTWQDRAAAGRHMVRVTMADTGRPAWYYQGEVFAADGGRGPVQAARAAVSRLERMADDLESFAITPRAVVGAGYRDGRKVARYWRKRARPT